ncbi:MAG: CotH kinase family protein [Flavobacteriales bacterium]|nr:CotH kinase family protein [Flavobacteriales bacterium]
MKKLGGIIFFLSATVLCIGIFKFGVHDGIKINIAAALCAIENRTSNNLIPSGLPVYNINIKEDKWSKLVDNLPQSGRKKKSISFIHEGKEYKGKLKIRGHLKLHWGGPKKSIRVYFEDDSPFGSINQMNFINPKTYQLTNDHIATWVGNRIGTNTLRNEMVFLRINGENYGVMEMVEQPTKRYAINKNKSEEEVILYKGDYLRDENGHATSTNLWKSKDNWVTKSTKLDDKPTQKLASLIQLLNIDSMDLEHRFRGIEDHVIIDEYIKYYAALTVINTMHIDQTHNQVIVYDPNQEKYYPILWDPTFMWVKEPNHYYNFYDPLSYYILQNPIWREKRDTYIYSYLLEYFDSGKFMTYHNQVEDNLWEAVKNDYKKCNPVGSNLNWVYRFSNSMYRHSNRKIRKTAEEYYQLLKYHIGNCNIEKLVTQDSIIQITYSTNSPLILDIECEEDVSFFDLEFKNITGQVIDVNGNFLKIKLYGQIEHEEGKEGSKYKIFSGFVQHRREEQIYIGAKIKNINIYNAITKNKINY